MLDAIEQVSNAIKNHTKWVEEIQEIIICHKNFDNHMVSENSHLECEFGQWLEKNKTELTEVDLKNFYEIYETHKKLHNTGKEILETAFQNSSCVTPIPQNIYEKLLKESKEIKKHLRIFRANLR